MSLPPGWSLIVQHMQDEKRHINVFWNVHAKCFTARLETETGDFGYLDQWIFVGVGSTPVEALSKMAEHMVEVSREEAPLPGLTTDQP